MAKEDFDNLMPIGAYLRKQAFAQPDALAIEFPHQNMRLNYREWYEQSLSLANALARVGVTKGDRVALLAESRVEWLVVEMAAALSGAVFTPLNSHYGRDDLEYALKKSKAKILFCSESFRSHAYFEMASSLVEELPELSTVVAFEYSTWGEFLSISADDAELPQIVLDDPAMLLFTSGTTGFPKGALLSHKAVMWDALGGAERLGTSSADRVTSIIPLFHCSGCVMNILGALQKGASYIGVPAFNPPEMYRVIQENKCTMLSGVPTSFLAMLEHPERKKYDLSTLRAGTCGGADADPEILRRCAAEFPMPGLVQVYGQTEVSTLSTCNAFDDPKRFTTAGPALYGVEVRITNPISRELLPAGEVGQVETKGPTNMIGYDQNPDATAETIDDEGWLLPGDLGFVDEEGYLRISGGRLKDLIIRGGENIYPVEIENVLRDHPKIEEIAVVAENDRYYGEIVAAVIKAKETVALEELAQFCNGKIAKFKIPAKLYSVEVFPMTASGKIQKNKLRDMISNEQLALLD